MVLQRGAAVRRKAQAKALDRFRSEATALEIAGAGTAGELRLEEGTRGFHDRAEAGAALVALALLGRVLRDFEPGLAGKTLHRVAEVQAFGLHDEGDGVAMAPQPKQW